MGYMHLHSTKELSTRSHKLKRTAKHRLMSAAKKINLGEHMVLCFLDLRTLWDEFLLSDFLETLPTLLSVLRDISVLIQMFPEVCFILCGSSRYMQ